MVGDCDVVIYEDKTSEHEMAWKKEGSGTDRARCFTLQEKVEYKHRRQLQRMVWGRCCNRETL